MKHEFLYYDRYNIFSKDNDYYLVDVGYLSWLITLFPPLFYFIRYPIYKISDEEFEKIKNNKNKEEKSKEEEKSKKDFSILIAAFIANMLLKTSINTHAILLSLLLSLIIIYLSYLLTKKLYWNDMKKNYYVPILKKTNKKITFCFTKYSFMNLIKVYLFQLFLLGFGISLEKNIIIEGKINVIYSILLGVLLFSTIIITMIFSSQNLIVKIKERG